MVNNYCDLSVKADFFKQIKYINNEKPLPIQILVC